MPGSMTFLRRNALAVLLPRLSGPADGVDGLGAILMRGCEAIYDVWAGIKRGVTTGPDSLMTTRFPLMLA